MIKCPNKAEYCYRHLAASFVKPSVAPDRHCARPRFLMIHEQLSSPPPTHTHILQHHRCQHGSRSTMALIFILFFLIMPFAPFFFSCFSPIPKFVLQVSFPFLISVCFHILFPTFIPFTSLHFRLSFLNLSPSSLPII